MRWGWLRTWRVFFLHKHSCEEMVLIFPQGFRAGCYIWLGAARMGAAHPCNLPSAVLLTCPLQSWESSRGIQGWETLEKQPKQQQQKGPYFRNRKKTKPSKAAQMSCIILFSFFSLTHLLALGKPAGGGCGTGRVLVGLVMPQRHRASLSLAHC